MIPQFRLNEKAVAPSGATAFFFVCNDRYGESIMRVFEDLPND